MKVLQKPNERERDLLQRRLQMINAKLVEEGLEPFERNRSFREGAEELTGRIILIDAPQADPWYKFVTFEVRKPFTGEIGYQTLVIPRKGDGVCVVPIFDGRFYAAVRQYRITVNDWTNEFPRGWVRKNQEIEKAAYTRFYGELPGAKQFRLEGFIKLLSIPLRENTGVYRASRIHCFMARLCTNDVDSASELQEILKSQAPQWNEPRTAEIEQFNDLMERGDGVGDVHSLSAWYLAQRYLP